MADQAFSSTALKERDKRLTATHAKEIQALERKIENLRRSNDDTRKQLFDCVQRTERLAHSLGFENVLEAQEVVDLLDEPVSFREMVGRIGELEAEVRAERVKREEVEVRLEEELVQVR